MSVVGCPRCGSDVPILEAEVGRSRVLTCPSCASRLEVSVFADGAETRFQPQLLAGRATSAARPASSDPAATVPLGSRTALLDPGGDAVQRGAVATVIRTSLILAGAEPGAERFPLTASKTTVGRESADIVIPDSAMSSRHFEIEVRGGEYFVRDLESSNGTFLNGNRIRAAQLASGDTIRAGRSALTFRAFEAIAVDETFSPAGDPAR
ncbi:MAG: FHA domain-containing protein [Acidobacteriota bacterium]|nr:FHA domain-containing protein [Acidobacteriota bacterium]MDH3523167.1 FHA domain-containing protein [Acidobacteriota bacterium]